MRISNDITATEVHFLGGSSGMGEERPPYGGGEPMAEDPYGSNDIDDLPF
jgi:hypothetical protein